jgi:hypothetical protein
MRERTPTVFLSSTVLDLADLRSAIKFWLEEFGYQVLASESSDFPHSLDRDAVAASLAPITNSDYYLLLVGSRVGAVIDGEGISVTRAEFRHARATRRVAARPQMLHFVRAEVEAARKLGRAPRGVAESDWGAITSFLDEVRQEEVAGDPNWVHPFTTFRDVVDVLRATLHLTGPLRRRALEANLKWEIIENTRELLHRTEKGIGVKARWLPKDQLPLAPSRVSEVRIDYPGTFWLFQFRMSLPRMATLSRSALEEGINSGLFLDYEPVASVQVVGQMQRTLLDLRLQMVRLDGLVDSINTDDAIRRDVARCVEAAKVERGTNVSDMTIAFLHAARDAMDNVLRLNRALYCHLEGLEPTLERPDLLPTSPYGSVPAEKREDPNRRETVTWLRLTGWPEATDRRSAAEAGLRAIDDPEIVRRLDEMEDRGESGV